MENGMSRSTTQACAACKYQRRKCGSTCILAPYFPHDRQKQFLNAHRLFGVGKISNMLKPLDQAQRDIAMSTILYQSDMRARDPVGGCLNVVQQLQSQIDYATAELQLVQQHLAFYRSQASVTTATTNNSNNNNHYGIVNSAPPVYVEPVSHEQQQQQLEQQLITFDALQEDVNMWAVENSVPLSPLIQEEDVNQNHVIDYGYDQKPVLELMDKMKPEAGSINQPP